MLNKEILDDLQTEDNENNGNISIDNFSESFVLNDFAEDHHGMNRDERLNISVEDGT